MLVMEPTTPREPTAALVARLAEIQGWKTGALRDELTRLTGSPAKSWNRPYLVRKVSWLTQAAARQTSDSVRDLTLVPEVRDVPRSPNLDAPIQVVPGRGVRDPRLPRPGTEIVRVYRGLRLVVTVLEVGYAWNGQLFPSLTAVAKAVTGCHWNGRLFFGLTPRRRGKGRIERSASVTMSNFEELLREVAVFKTTQGGGVRLVDDRGDVIVMWPKGCPDSPTTRDEAIAMALAMVRERVFNA